VDQEGDFLQTHDALRAELERRIAKGRSPGQRSRRPRANSPSRSFRITGLLGRVHRHGRMSQMVSLVGPARYRWLGRSRRDDAKADSAATSEAREAQSR
jgi:hypothetical protein